MNLSNLQTIVIEAIDTFEYQASPHVFGMPLSPDWIQTQLIEFKASLVTPTRKKICIRDSVDQMLDKADSEIRSCILVADDKIGHELFYNPILMDYVLAYSGDMPTRFNLRGDAVGCFLSR